MKVKVQMLDSKSFSPYGDVIGSQDSKPAIAEPMIKFWPGVSDIKLTSDIAQLHWLEIRPRPFMSESFERHTNTTEGLFPMAGQSIVVFALSTDMDDLNSPVDYSTIKAFILDGTKAINLKKGVWHDIPFLLTDKADFVVLFEKETHEKDLEVIKLKEKIELIL
jgi:ureidoglycolate hydrolase